MTPEQTAPETKRKRRHNPERTALIRRIMDAEYSFLEAARIADSPEYRSRTSVREHALASVAASVEEWNRTVPVGTRVMARSLINDPPEKEWETRTRSVAWMPSSSSALVLIEGRTGGWALTHLRVIP